MMNKKTGLCIALYLICPAALFANDMGGIVYILALALGDIPLLVLSVGGIIFALVAARRQNRPGWMRIAALVLSVLTGLGCLVMTVFHLFTSVAGDERMVSGGRAFALFFLPVFICALISVYANASMFRKK